MPRVRVFWCVKIALLVALYLPLFISFTACRQGIQGNAIPSCRGAADGGVSSLASPAGEGGGTGTGEGGGTTGTTIDLGDDTTGFRPDELPATTASPSYLIAARLLTPTQSMGEVEVSVTHADSGLPAAGAWVDLVRIRPTSAASTLAARTAVPSRLTSNGSYTVIDTHNVTVDANGQAVVDFSQFQQETDQIWIASPETGGSTTVVVGVHPALVKIQKLSGTDLAEGDVLSTVAIHLKFNMTMDPTTLSGITLSCARSGLAALDFFATPETVDTIVNNEYSFTSSHVFTHGESCTLTFGSGVEDGSEHALDNPFAVRVTMGLVGLPGAPVKNVAMTPPGSGAVVSSAKFRGFVNTSTMTPKQISTDGTYFVNDPFVELNIDKIFDFSR